MTAAELRQALAPAMELLSNQRQGLVPAPEKLSPATIAAMKVILAGDHIIDRSEASRRSA